MAHNNGTNASSERCAQIPNKTLTPNTCEGYHGNPPTSKQASDQMSKDISREDREAKNYNENPWKGI